MSPIEDIESDLREAQLLSAYPMAMLSARLQGIPRPKPTGRVFLTGANPFVLKSDRLMDIAGLIRLYIPSVRTIGCFARITDVARKTDGELASLGGAGYDGLTIGVETGDDEALEFMNKGYTSADILDQCQRLDRAGIGYSFFYLAGISGAGRGEAGARASAAVFNRLRPARVGVNMLTVYPDSELYGEVLRGAWREESEIEKYREVRALIESLEISTEFAALGASNAFQIQGALPEDKGTLLGELDRIIENVEEEDLREYRRNLPHL